MFAKTLTAHDPHQRDSEIIAYESTIAQGGIVPISKSSERLAGTGTQAGDAPKNQLMATATQAVKTAPERCSDEVRLRGLGLLAA